MSDWRNTHRDDLGALGHKGLCLLARRVPRHAADRPLGLERLVAQEDVGDAPALAARGANDGDDLLGHCQLLFRSFDGGRRV